jgi:hypothetical protein
MTMKYETAAPQNGAASPDQSRRAQLAERAGEEAANVADTATEGIREVADEVRTQAKAVAGQARQQVDGVVDQAREEIRQQAEQRNDQAAGQLRTLSERITALVEGRPEGAGPLVGLLQDAEDQVRRLAGRLEQRGPQGVMDDVSTFARRRPGMFIAGAVGVGFLVGRAVRAGSSTQQADATERQLGATTQISGPRLSLASPRGDAALTPPAVPSVVSGTRP